MNIYRWSQQSWFVAFVLNILQMCYHAIQIHKWLKILGKTILKFINLSNMKYKSVHCSSVICIIRNRENGAIEWTEEDGVQKERKREIIKPKWVINIGYIDENGTLTMRNDLYTWSVPSNYSMKTVSTNSSKPDEADENWFTRNTSAMNDTMNGNHKCHRSVSASHITIAVSWVDKKGLTDFLHLIDFSLSEITTK